MTMVGQVQNAKEHIKFILLYILNTESLMFPSLMACMQQVISASVMFREFSITTRYNSSHYHSVTLIKKTTVCGAEFIFYMIFMYLYSS